MSRDERAHSFNHSSVDAINHWEMVSLPFSALIKTRTVLVLIPYPRTCGSIGADLLMAEKSCRHPFVVSLHIASTTCHLFMYNSSKSQHHTKQNRRFSR